MNKLATLLIACALVSPAFALESRTSSRSGEAPKIEAHEPAANPIRSIKRWYHKEFAKKKTTSKTPGTPSAAFNPPGPDAPWVLPS